MNSSGGVEAVAWGEVQGQLAASPTDAGTSTGSGSSNDCAAGRHRLSVVIRTVGNRNDRLEEALLCLAGQDEPVGDVHLVVHRVVDAPLEPVSELAAWARETLGLDLTLHTVDHGRRGAPLNTGMAAADGCLIAFLDDDDHVLGNWSGNLLAGHALDPTRVVRIQAAVRPVRSVVGGGIASTSRPFTPYAVQFSWLQHCTLSHTPIHAFAVPRSVIHEHAIRFDETLPVVEDWDVLLQASLWAGVTDVGGIAAIYNQFPHERHSGETELAWRAAEDRVRERVLGLAGRAVDVDGFVPRGLVSDVAFWLSTFTPGSMSGNRRVRTINRLRRAYTVNSSKIDRLVPPGGPFHTALRAAARALER